MATLHHTDTDVLNAYFDLSARADSYGLRLAVTRTLIVLRDAKTSAVIAQAPSIAQVTEELQALIDANGFER